MDWLRYANQGATRNLPLSSQMTDALSFLPNLGVTMEVFSGGQPAAGGGPRVGSTRHDHGNAADVFFYKDGQRLDWRNPEHVPLFQQIVSQGRQNGLTGFGAGDGYMQPGSMHIGFGAPAVWGKDGRSANAPDWLRGTNGSQDIADATMQTLGRAPIRPQQTISTRSPQTEAPQMQNEKAGGLLGKLFPNMTADRRDELIVGMSGLSMHPNQGAMQMAGQRIADRRADGKEAKAQAAEQQKVNRTIQAMRQQGAPEYLIAAAEAGNVTGAFNEFLRMKGQQPEQPKPTDDMREYEYARSQGFQGSLQDWIISQRSAGATNINNNVGNSEFGTIPPGYELFTDPQGNRRMRPIEGGPVAIEQRQAAQAAEQADTARGAAQATQGNVVLNQVGAIRKMMNSGGMFDLPEVGVFGNALAKMGVNQEAVDMGNRLTTLQGMVSFDQLAKMRAASPTGGALGGIAIRELELLQSQLGSLDQSSSPEVIRETLDLLESVMRRADAYPNAQEYGFGGASQGGAPSGPNGTLSNEQLLKKYGYTD